MRLLEVEELAENRDPKGLYKKARQGLIPEFTGIDAPYEAPIDPEVRVDTDTLGIAEAAQQIHHRLSVRGFLSPPTTPETAP